MAVAAAWESVNARVEQFRRMEPDAAVAALLSQIKDTHSSQVPYLTALGMAGPPARAGDAVSLDGVADHAIGHLAATGLPDARRPAGVVHRIALASLLGNKHADKRALEDAVALAHEAIRADPASSAARWSMATTHSILVKHHGYPRAGAVTAYEGALEQFGGAARAPGSFLVEYAEFAHIHMGDLVKCRILLEEAVLVCTKGRSWRSIVRSADESSIGEPLAVVVASALAQLGLLAQHGSGGGRGSAEGDAAGLGGRYGRLELEDAGALYEASLRCNPFNADTHTNLGLFRSEVQRRWREAAELHRQAIRLDPTHATALYNLGTLVASDGGGSDKAQAVELYKRAVECQPDHTFALFNLAIAFEEDGDVEEARTVSCQSK